MKKQSKKWIKHITFLLIGIFLFGLFIYFTNKDNLSKLKEIQYLPAVLALLASLGITSMISFRWGTIVNELAGEKVASWRQYYHYFVQSRALGFILPNNLTDLGVRILWLKKGHKSKLSDAGISVILDRIFDLIFLLVYSAAVLPFWFGLINMKIGIAVIITLFALLGVILIFKQKLFFKIFKKILNIGIKIFSVIPLLKKKVPEKLEIPEFSTKAIVKIFFSSAIKVFFTITRFVLYIYVFSIVIDPLIIIAGTPVAQLSYAFSFTPGGLGILEAGWLGILKVGNVETQQALLYVIGQRILTIILVSLLALISQILFSFLKIKK